MMARRTRVLMILFNLAGGGAERASLDLLRALDRARFEPALLLIRQEGVYWHEVPDGIRVESLVAAGRRLRHAWPRLAAGLYRASASADVIVGGLEGDATYFAVLGGVVAKRPVVAWVHSHLEASMRAFRPLQRRLVRWTYPRTTSVVCVSHQAAVSLARAVGVPSVRALVIPPPVDLGRVCRLAGDDVDEALAGDDGHGLLLGIGRLVPQKRFDVLIRAHAALRAAGSRHRLVILGEGPLRADLEALARTLGVTDSVALPGFASNPYPIIRRAAVVALPSDCEGSPLVLVEAMALGVPVVATPASSEVVGDGRFGLVVPAGDWRALADACRHLLEHPAERARLASAARARAEEFEAGTIARRWADLLERTSLRAAPPAGASPA